VRATQHHFVIQIYKKDLIFVFFVPNFLPKMTTAFVAICKIACVEEKWTSSIAKLAYTEAFEGFAIVLGNCAEIL
jgi:hypothetical protein